MEPELKKQRRDGEPSAGKEAEDFPTPTSYLIAAEDLKDLALEVDITVDPFMTAENYKEALNCPLQCNLRLKTVLAEPAELESFGALLPAADACCLSSVIKARLQRWAKPNAEGRAELELQIAVSQQILDRVVRAIYNRELLIESSSAESLLLVSDYLQMEWLTEAVGEYAEEKLIAQPSLEVCKFALAYPKLAIWARAAGKLLASAPELNLIADLMVLASESERAVLLRVAADTLTSKQCVDYLLGLSKHPEVGLSSEEAMMLVNTKPNLGRLPRESWFGGTSGDAHTTNLTLWAKLYIQQKVMPQAEIPACIGTNFLVWDIPLQEASEPEALLFSPEKLTSSDGRIFQLYTSSTDSEVGVYVSAFEGSLKKGDSFQIFPLANISLQRGITITADCCSLGYAAWISELGRNVNYTIADGKLLPVALQML